MSIVAEPVLREWRSEAPAPLLRNLAIPPPESVTEWAERAYVIPPQAAEPGRYRVERTPFAREIMDTVTDPNVEQIAVLAGVQIGKTTFTEIALGYWIDRDPGPVLIVYPDQAAAEERVSRYVLGMIERSPVLRAHLPTSPHDLTRSTLTLRGGMEIHAAWATAPQSLASRFRRYVIFDETDKYPLFSGRDADPISLGEMRTTTFGHRRKLLYVSTCSTRDGPIWRVWEKAADRRMYQIPCPECGAFSVMLFANVRWPGAEKEETTAQHADRIYATGAAWYECPKCGARIEERQKPGMLARGVWASEGQTVRPDGTLEGERAVSTTVAFRISSLYSPWFSWSRIVREFLLAGHEPGPLMAFRNNYLAEPFEQQLAAPKLDAVRAKVRAAAAAGVEAGSVPEWATMLLATADVQLDHFYFVVRAWGHGNRSRLVLHGRVEGPGEVGFERLRQACLETSFPIEGGEGRTARATALFIDAGYRTNEVYEFARANMGHVFPVRGHGGGRRAASPVYARTVQQVGKQAVRLYLVDTGLWKDTLAHRIRVEEGDGEWLLHGAVSDEYCRHMTSEHKILVRRGSKAPEEVWDLVAAGTPNHYWDCEVYQCAAVTQFEWERFSPLSTPPARPQKARAFRTPDGRPFLVTQRR